MEKLQINDVLIESKDGTTQIYVNGINLSNCVTKFECIQEAGEVPTLRLDFPLRHFVVGCGTKIKLEIPKEFIDLIKK